MYSFRLKYQKCKLSSVIFFLFYFFFSFNSHSNSSLNTITIWGEFHPPLNALPNEPDPGFMIEIAQTLFEKHGYRVEYILGPRARGVKMVQEGKIDCVVNAKVKDHNVLTFPEQPWSYHAATLYANHNSSFAFNSLSDLKHVKLGAISGLKYDNGQLDEYIESHPENISFSYGNRAMENQVLKLESYKTDVLVSCPLLMRGQLSFMDYPQDKFKVIGEIKAFVGMYLGCEKGRARTEKFIDLINETIPKMRKNGELQEILDKYGQIDWIGIHRELGRYTNEQF